MNLTDAFTIKEIMSKFGKKFSKSLGQNFLTDPSVIDASVSASDPKSGDVAFEIGPGIGVLTAALGESFERVVTVEIDKMLIPVLNFTLSGYNNITVVNDDFMKIDLAAFAEKYFEKKRAKVVANLPYYITTPVLVRLLENKEHFSSVTVLVQKEVALRMAADPGTKDYGMLTLLINYHATAEIVKIVPPESFMPPPKVSSAVIHLTIREKPPVNPKDVEFMFKIIKASFAQRRKTLVNGLINGGLGITKDVAQNALESRGLNPLVRGEVLSLRQFSDLSDILYEKMSKI